MLKKSLILAISLVVIATGMTGAVRADVVPDEQWNLPMNAPDQDAAELIGLRIANSSVAFDAPSYLNGDQTDSGNTSSFLLCSSLTDSNCSTAARVDYQSFLPPCTSAITLNCISGVSAISPDGKEIQGTYAKNIPTVGSNDYPGDSTRNLPTGSTPSVWTIPEVTNGGGSDSYLIRFAVKGRASAGQRFHSDSIRAALYPITTQSGNYHAPHMNDINHPSEACVKDHYRCGFGSELSGNNTQLSAACVAFDLGLCALRQSFPAGYRFKISAILGDSPTGWFHGRFYDPQISLNSENGVTKLSIDASPVKVPVVGTYIKQSAMTPEMKAYYAVHNGMGAFGRLSPNGISNLISSPEPSDPYIFTEFALWSSFFKDKASANQSEWSFRTLDLQGQNTSCFNDKSKLVGVVSTNAMIYSGGAPAFNQSEGSLDYKVGSPHYASNGDVFKGTYDLSLRSDVARCLYNFSSAPIKATISITNETGDANVATTVVSEDKATGWLHMSASNFTFSNPTVKIKLTQDAPVKAALPVKTKSITCLKGKLTTVVSTANCPVGYKKK